MGSGGAGQLVLRHQLGEQGQLVARAGLERRRALHDLRDAASGLGRVPGAKRPTGKAPLWKAPPGKAPNGARPLGQEG